jgi:hypothetical protein
MKTTHLMMAAVSLCTAAALCACGDKDEDNNTTTISGATTIKVDGGSTLDIDSVKLNLGLVVYSVAYANGEFTLDFHSVDDKYLGEVTRGLPSGVTASNANVKVDDAYIPAYKSGIEVGSFYHGTADWEGFPMYANGDVNITGTGTNEGHTTKFNVKLKKGWNIMYTKDTETTYEATTQAPAGAAWRYKSNNE